MAQAKPLFSGEFIAFSEFDRQALRILLRSLDRPFLRAIEIGSWLGNGSTRTLGEELKGRGVLFCVDHWLGNANVERHQKLVAEYDVFATFQANVISYGCQDVIRTLRMSSQEAASIVKDHVFDLVFIDGDHSYQETINDITSWLPKVRKGGILCGHDCEGRPADFEGELLWRHRADDSIAGNARFTRIHPGPILAVAEKLGPETRLFADESVRLEDGREGLSTLWAWRN